MQQAKVMIEPLIVRQEWFMESKMPFSDTSGRVAVVFQQFSDRELIWMQPVLESARWTQVAFPTRRG